MGEASFKEDYEKYLIRCAKESGANAQSVKQYIIEGDLSAAVGLIWPSNETKGEK